MTTKQAAEYLEISVVTVQALAKKGVIKGDQPGREWQLDPRSVAAYKRNRGNQGTQRGKSSAPDTKQPK